MQLPMCATFSTSRRRPVIIASIATLLAVVFVPQEFDFSRDLVWKVGFDLLFVWFLVVAVRAWIAAFRPQAELRMTAEGLAMKYGRRELTVPWAAVGQFRIDEQKKTRWVVVWLNPSVPVDQVPVPRQPNGGFRVLPIGRGRSTTQGTQDLGRFRSAAMGFSGHYLYPA